MLIKSIVENSAATKWQKEGIFMSKGKGSALTIIALIIGASGLGIGIFSILDIEIVEGPQGPPGTDGIDGINGTLDNVVAIWDSLWGSGVDFNITLTQNALNKSGYYHLSDSDTVLHLTKAGWYRLTYKFVWMGLVSTDEYRLWLQKNGVNHELIWWVNLPTSTYEEVNGVVYAYSDGTDFFSLRSTATVDLHNIFTSGYANQFTLEYVNEA